MMSGRSRATIVIALIAVCSALAGAAVERLGFTHMGRRRGGGGGGPPGRGGPEVDARRRGEMMDRMTRDLSLTPAQREGIDSVMKRTDSSLHAIRLEMQPRISAVMEASRAEMSARLTPDQREKFEKDRGRRRVERR